MLITSLVMSLNQLLPVAILLILLQVIAKQSLVKVLGMLVLGDFGFGSLVILALLSLLAFIPSVTEQISITKQGLIYAVLSGAVASGVGYSLWYYVVKKLNTVVASIAQLSVPVIATLGGVLLLSEPVTMQFVISSTVILLGISLVLVAPKLKK